MLNFSTQKLTAENTGKGVNTEILWITLRSHVLFGKLSGLSSNDQSILP